MTRVGKIARLPRAIREKLNHGIQDNQPGKQLVDWLNSLPKVQTVLRAEFEGRAINEPNLTEWKQGGYRDWLNHQEALNLAREFAADADELQKVTAVSLTDKITPLLAARYLMVLKSLSAVNPEDEDGWKQLRELSSDLVALRKGDHSAERLRIERERLELERTLVAPDLDQVCPVWAADPANYDKFPERPTVSLEEKKAQLCKIFGINTFPGDSQKPDAVSEINPAAAPAVATELNQIKPD